MVGGNCSWVLIVDFDSIDTLDEIIEMDVDHFGAELEHAVYNIIKMIFE